MSGNSFDWDNISRNSIAQIKMEAKKAGLEIPSKVNKTEMIALLQSHVRAAKAPEHVENQPPSLVKAAAVRRSPTPPPVKRTPTPPPVLGSSRATPVMLSRSSTPVAAAPRWIPAWLKTPVPEVLFVCVLSLCICYPDSVMTFFPVIIALAYVIFKNHK